MANSKSAKKRIKVNRRNRIENNSYKSLLKTSTKEYIKSVEVYRIEPNVENYAITKNSLAITFSVIDKAAKKKILHKNNAARKKSRLSQIFKKCS